MFPLSKFLAVIAFTLGAGSIAFALVRSGSPELIDLLLPEGTERFLLPAIPYCGALTCLFLAGTSRHPAVILWVIAGMGLFLAGIGSTEVYVSASQTSFLLTAVEIISGGLMVIAGYRLSRIWEYLEDEE